VSLLTVLCMSGCMVSFKFALWGMSCMSSLLSHNAVMPFTARICDDSGIINGCACGNMPISTYGFVPVSMCVWSLIGIGFVLLMLKW